MQKGFDRHGWIGCDGDEIRVRAVLKEAADEISEEIDMAADRGAYIDQSQSLNLFMPQERH